jgi:hypothetical protein
MADIRRGSRHPLAKPYAATINATGQREQTMNKPEFSTITNAPFAERYDNFIGGAAGSRPGQASISTTFPR